MPGTLFVVATPIGHLDDISARALDVLRRVAVIAAEDTRRTARLLSHHGIATPTTSLHEHNERRKARSLIDRLAAGDDLALVSDAGMPTISDPGTPLVRAAADAGIRVEVIPGPSAVMTALAASGFSSVPFSFLGFPPPKGRVRQAWFSSLSRFSHPIVFFEAPHRITRTLEDLQVAVGDVPVVVARELTKAHETLVRGPISDVLRAGLREQGEFTVVADLGHITDRVQPGVPNDSAMATEFGVMTNSGGLERREALGRLATKYQIPARAVYAALERAKKSVE